MTWYSVSMKPSVLDPEETLRALEGQKDILTEDYEREVEYLKKLRCPACYGDQFGCRPDTDRPFSPGRLLPNYLVVCRDCGTEFAPYSGVILRHVPSDLDLAARFAVRTAPE